jgi:hypothetical protein
VDAKKPLSMAILLYPLDRGKLSFARIKSVSSRQPKFGKLPETVPVGA